MYRIIIENDGVRQVLHSEDPDSMQRLLSGTMTEEVGASPSLTGTVSPQNACYNDFHDRRTEITVTNAESGENEFEGYVLNSRVQMSNAGKISRRFVCEGFQGYLCDTVQMYHNYEETPVAQFLAALLASHNAQSEPRKHIFLGTVNVTGNLNSKTTAYRSTWGEIKENLLDRLGGEIRIRRGTDGRLLLDYLDAVSAGSTSGTVIELANNMRSISVETDTTNIITRLIPLGYQVTADTAERLTIEGAVDPDDGHTYTVPYIDDDAAIAQYGIIVGTAEFDDITVKENLYARGKAYLAENNRIKKHYAASVLDIVGRGSIRAGGTYRFRNALIGLDENLRLLKRKVDLLKPYTPDVEIGDKAAKISSMTAQNRNLLNYEIPQQLSQTVQASKAIATQLITAATTGYVVLRPNEILIMDTDDVATATSVWRWNTGGLGYSHSSTPGEAYDGPYGTAITMNGMIVADFIAAGTMFADRIRGGTLRMGGTDNVNGVIEVVDAGGTVVCRLDKDGAYILGTVYTESASGYWLELQEGNLSGGHGSDEYVRMDATATITDQTQGGSVTYHGLRLHANAVSFEDCKHIGINNGSGGVYLGLTGNIEIGGTVSLNVQTATLEHVAIIDPSDNTFTYTDLTYVTGVTATTANGQTIHFESGLATA